MPKCIVWEKDPEIKKALSKYLTSEAIDRIFPTSKEEVLEMIDFEDVTIVVVNEQDSEMLQKILSLPMYKRRNIFLILLSKSLQSLDRVSAFCHSVNFIVNVNDIESFPETFAKAFREYENIYRQFKELIF